MDNEAELVKEGPDYRDSGGEYLPLTVEGLKTGVATDLDLYAKVGDGYFIVKPRNIELDGFLISKSRTQNAPYLYIHSKDKEKYYLRLEQNISKIIHSSSVPLREKAGVLTDYAVEVVNQLFQDPGSPRAITQATGLTQECIRFISLHKHAFLHLVELSGHDHYTYAHSVGVAAYTIALVPEVMRPTPEQLVDIGLAGLLHDIGKTMVDPAIINKRGPLTEDEWASMKKHPEYGSEILRRHKNLSSVIAISAEAHHENLLGTGYPKGLVASKTDPLIRIISLTDAFSALTTKRSYSTPRDSMSALKLIKENLNKKFDTNLFQPFVKLFLEPAKKKAA